MRSALGLGLGVTQNGQADGAAAPTPTERIINTTLDTSDNTSAPQGGWAFDVLSGVTNTIALRQLQFELTAPISAGNVSQVQVDVGSNPNAANVMVEAFATGDSSFFLMLDDSSGLDGIKTANNVAVTGGPYDRVRIRCSGDADTVISGLSVIA